MKQLSREIAILRNWAPLALVWLVMSIEQPTIGAVVNRLPDPATSLAAFEIAFSLAAIIHSPILQFLSGGAALVTDRAAFGRVLRFLASIVLVFTAIHLVVAIRPVFTGIAGSVLNAPAAIIPGARRAFLVLIPITGAVGLRRLLQGAMVRVGATRYVTLVTAERVAATTIFLLATLAAYRVGVLRNPSGSTVAAAAFIVGVTTGALGSVYVVHRAIIHRLPSESSRSLSLRSMTRFYIPLGLTGTIMTIGRPLLAFAIGRSPDPGASLAAWAIAAGFISPFASIAASYQEVVIARADDPSLNRPIRRLGLYAGSVLSLLVLLITATPALRLWFTSVIRVPPELIDSTRGAVAILLPYPFLTGRIAYVSGRLISDGRTARIAAGTATQVAAHLILAILLPGATALDGARIAALIVTASAVLQLAVLSGGTAAMPGAQPRG